jgi:hypothetical protein
VRGRAFNKSKTVCAIADNPLNSEENSDYRPPIRLNNKIPKTIRVTMT